MNRRVAGRKKKKIERSKEEERVLTDLASDAIDEMVEEGAPQWSLTFGDMMSLLLCFFILLFSMSEIKMAEFMQAASSMRAGFGSSHQVAETSAAPSEEAEQAEPSTESILERKVDDSLEDILRQLEEFISENDLEQHLAVVKDDIGVTLRIMDVVLFSPGSAEIIESSRWIFEKLSAIVNEFDYPLLISGHTDNIPISTENYPSNWELSSARASRVTRVAIENGLDPNRIHVEGHAEFKPVSDNDTPEGRAKNRRVELVYTRQSIRDKIINDESIVEDVVNQQQ